MTTAGEYSKTKDVKTRLPVELQLSVKKKIINNNNNNKMHLLSSLSQLGGMGNLVEKISLKLKYL